MPRTKTGKASAKRVARCLPLETGLTSVLGCMGPDDLKALYQV
jgi:hypothetical protein